MKPTADIKRFYEAVEWFRQRTGLSPEAAGEILRRANARAVVGTAKAQLDMVLDVYRAAERAKAAGLDFTQFKEMVRGAIAHKESRRLASIFRESVQNSYMKTRAEALSTPSMLLARPFWRFTSILDERTTEVCTACHRTTLPAGHPWWKTHIPPLHFRCRSTIVALTPQQAKAYGVTKRPTRTEAQPWTSKDGTDSINFGSLGEEFLPDISKMPAKFRRLYQAKVERVMEYFKTPKAKRKPIRAPAIDKPSTHS